MPSPRQLARNHPRLTVALIAGVIIAIALPSAWNPITRILTGWNVAVWSYLMLMWSMMVTANHARVKRIAEQEDANAASIVTVLSFAAVLSIAAIVIELASAKSLDPQLKTFHYLFTALTVIGSWLLVGTVYTFHYAHLYYRSPAHKRALRFPDEEKNPDYWDFLYFSFTIAVAAQTSDISVMSRSTRKAVMAQSILSFVFNAAIIGTSINIAAGLIGS